MLRRVSITATLVYGMALSAWAVDVPIANAGFEQPVLPCAQAPCYGFNVPVPGWTGTGTFYSLRPSIGAGGMFPNGIPEGVNTVALGNDSASGALVQTLGATLQPNTVYTLVFSVGSRADYAFGGYSVELLAASTTLATDSSLVPPSGTFVTGRIVYPSTNANSALLGQRLGIRLTGITARGQANFDKISLDATPTVVSSSASQIASGGGWKTTTILINLSSTQNAVRVAFRGDDGRPLTLPITVTHQGTSQPASASTVERTVEPGATLVIESEAPVSSPTLIGWAEVVSAGPVSGFAIFRQRSQDGRDAEGTAPLESGGTASLVLPFDNTVGFSTGVALVNSTAQAVVVNATIRDDNGVQLGLQAVALPAMGHASFAIVDRFSVTGGRRGFIEFQNTAGGAIAGLGLRFSPSGSFTSVPVIVR
ncbi:MAG: hypothetical protein ACKV2U_01910 [Bryobacteraceae bacterium]